MAEVVYSELCPVCGKDLSFEELLNGLCRREGKPLCQHRSDTVLEQFLDFFRKVVGKPREIQVMWARRVFNGESFSAIAPTGVGKTTFGIVMSLFLARESRRCYVLLPTTLLVTQVVERLKEYASVAGIRLLLNQVEGGEVEVGIGIGDGIAISYYHSGLTKRERERFFEALNKSSILITTSQFLIKHFSRIKGNFDFIFVDDVDSVLKNSKNVSRILNLLGFRYDGGWKGDARGCLMVSTATGSLGRNINLFRKLLNFDIAESPTIRNVEDIAINSKKVEVLRELLERMGRGGVIYTKSTEEAERIYENLKKEFRIGLVEKGRKKERNFEKFKKGEIDFLIGTSHYYGTLVRGVDLPERIRFVVFYGAPAFKISIHNMSISLLRSILYRLSTGLRDWLKLEEPEITSEIEKFERNTDNLREKVFLLLREIRHAKVHGFFDFAVEGEEIVFPDVRTYIQGSGRTSRLFSGGITKGVSFLLEDDRNVMNAFIKRARYYDIEFEEKDLENIDFEVLNREIDDSRDTYRKRNEIELIRPALLIVESPTKAKQISRFFGKPGVRVVDNMVVYETATSSYVLLVSACMGHVTDLITNRGFHGVELEFNKHSDGLRLHESKSRSLGFVPVYSSIKRCVSCGNQVTFPVDACPKCGSEIIDSAKIIGALRKLAKETGNIIIATDPDSEGEKIAWDLKNLLKGCGNVKRAEFHEITKKAFVTALENLREIDENLVKAQMARRIEDRWIGFVLSQKLWREFGNKHLSAGRAQTPVLGWIIERARQHRRKKIIAIVEEMDLALEHDKSEFDVEIHLIEEKKVERTPLPPYTTDTLLSDANRVLKLGTKQCMEIAQHLFESGLITYHRTDSTRVSAVGLKVAKEYLGGDFAARGWMQEGAHECIRPTRPFDKTTLQRLIYEGILQIKLDKKHLAVYDLIFRRFMASQCRNYVVEVAKYRITFDGKYIDAERTVGVEGRAYELYGSEVVRRRLPEGRHKVKAKLIRVPERDLLSQSDIIQMMKERGIGRPSTYAGIIEKLFIRGYVRERGGRVFPTRLGISVFNFLSNFRTFISEERTRAMEDKMDRIERGELDFESAIDELYREISFIDRV